MSYIEQIWANTSILQLASWHTMTIPSRIPWKKRSHQEKTTDKSWLKLVAYQTFMVNWKCLAPSSQLWKIPCWQQGHCGEKEQNDGAYMENTTGKRSLQLVVYQTWMVYCKCVTSSSQLWKIPCCPQGRCREKEQHDKKNQENTKGKSSLKLAIYQTWMVFWKCLAPTNQLWKEIDSRWGLSQHHIWTDAKLCIKSHVCKFHAKFYHCQEKVDLLVCWYNNKLLACLRPVCQFSDILKGIPRETNRSAANGNKSGSAWTVK